MSGQPSDSGLPRGPGRDEQTTRERDAAIARRLAEEESAERAETIRLGADRIPSDPPPASPWPAESGDRDAEPATVYGGPPPDQRWLGSPGPPPLPLYGAPPPPPPPPYPPPAPVYGGPPPWAGTGSHPSRRDSGWRRLLRRLRQR